MLSANIKRKTLAYVTGVSPLTQQQGYKAISILIDSGASDSVAPPGLFSDIQVFETNASRGGLEYTAAGGHKLPNLGMCRPIVHRTDGSAMTMSFQVAAYSCSYCTLSYVPAVELEYIAVMHVHDVLCR